MNWTYNELEGVYYWKDTKWRVVSGNYGLETKIIGPDEKCIDAICRMADVDALLAKYNNAGSLKDIDFEEVKKLVSLRYSELERLLDIGNENENS